MVIQSGRELRFVTDRYIAQCKARRTSSQVNELAAELGLSATDLSNLFLKFHLPYACTHRERQAFTRYDRLEVG